MNQVNRNNNDKKREKAKELFEISLKLHNELRPNMKLKSTQDCLIKSSTQEAKEFTDILSKALMLWKTWL